LRKSKLDTIESDALGQARRVNDDPTVLHLERVLDAPPERIYAAWTDPALLRRWWAAAPGWTTPEATTDVRVGGAYRLSMRGTDGIVRTVVGEYLEVDPPRRLVYTWKWVSSEYPAPDDGVTVVSVDFIAEGTATRVVLEQRDHHDEAGRDSHGRGWRGCLDSLERLLAAG
jgi:uncharacterized protein YndB with AHSA1/START domain